MQNSFSGMTTGAVSDTMGKLLKNLIKNPKDKFIKLNLELAKGSD